MAQWIDFTGSLKELEFMALRKELRQIIGAVYGVLPLYYGEMVGGWSQEGLQVTITNRAVKWGQDVLYASFLKKFSELMNVDDWDIKLVQGEENDKLAELQRDGVEIQNMALLQQMGFDISRSHTGDFKVSKEAQPMEPVEMGRGRGTAAPKELQQNFDGQPKLNRPSDIGGIAAGSPSSGSGTSLSQKNFADGITPNNFDVIKTTLQTALDFGWKKTKTVDELRKFGMTVRQARAIVKNELGTTRRWEDEENNDKKDDN